MKLFLSGGIDSEAMARSFLAAGTPFTAVIGRYNRTMNGHDYGTAVSFCRENKIEIEYVDVDVYDFLEAGRHLVYGRELGCRSPQIAVHLHLLDQVSGFPVLAGNPVYGAPKDPQDILRRESQPLELGQITGLPGQTHSVYLRYFEKRGRAGEAFFFQSSPELLFSFLCLDEALSAMAAGEQTHDYAMKCRLYRSGGFTVEPRTDKFTGFEKYRAEYDRRMNTAHGTGFNERFRRPLEILTPELPQRTLLPLPPQIAEGLIRKIQFASPSSVDLASGLSRRRILTGAWAAAATAFAGWLLPLPAQALACYPSCMSSFIGSPKQCQAAMQSCGDL